MNPRSASSDSLPRIGPAPCRTQALLGAWELDAENLQERQLLEPDAARCKRLGGYGLSRPFREDDPGVSSWFAGR